MTNPKKSIETRTYGILTVISGILHVATCVVHP